MGPKILPDLRNFLKDWYGFKPVAPQRFSVFDILHDKKVSHHVYQKVKWKNETNKKKCIDENRYGDTPLEFTLSADIFYPTVRDFDVSCFIPYLFILFFEQYLDGLL
jgi:hypothetical protein